MNSTFRRVAVLVAAALLVALFTFAEDTTALVGKWNMVSETDGDSVPWVLVLREAHGKVSGALTTDGSEIDAKDFTYKEGVIRFQAPYQGEYYDIELKLLTGKLEGTWSGGGQTGRTTGTKAP